MDKPKKTQNVEDQKNWRERQKQMGMKQVGAWLPQEVAEDLTKVKKDHGYGHIGEVIQLLLKEYHATDAR